MRYYKAKYSGKLASLDKILIAQRQAHSKAVRKKLKEHGIDRAYLSRDGTIIVGVTFKDPDFVPDGKIWKKAKGRYSPRRNTLSGKEMANSLDGFPFVDWEPIWIFAGWNGPYFSGCNMHEHPGFCISDDKKWALFHTAEMKEWKPSKALIAITFDEFVKLGGEL